MIRARRVHMISASHPSQTFGRSVRRKLPSATGGLGGVGKRAENFSPLLPAWLSHEFNAPNALILPLSRRRIMAAPQGDGEGAKACDLRGLGVPSSGRARRRRLRQGARLSSIWCWASAEHGYGVGRGADEGDRLAAPQASRERATRARPARRGLRAARRQHRRTPLAPGQTIARSVGPGRNGIFYRASEPRPALRVPPPTSAARRVRRSSRVQSWGQAHGPVPVPELFPFATNLAAPPGRPSAAAPPAPQG